MVILGFFNFSRNAEEENEENLPAAGASLAAQFGAECGWVYAQTQNPPKK